MMRTYIANTGVAGTVLAVLLAAAPESSRTLDGPLAAVLDGRRTYGWLPAAPAESPPPFVDAKITTSIREEVDHHLDRSGFRLVRVGDDALDPPADFRVDARVVMERSGTPLPGRYEPGPETLDDDAGFRGAEPGTAYDPADRLTAVLSLAVFDGATGALLWTRREPVHLDLDPPYRTEPRELLRRLRETAREMLTDPLVPDAAVELGAD